MKKPIGILGGTFDPIHNGHMQIATYLYENLNLQEVRFIPCKQNLLKEDVQATSAHRLAMLEIALDEHPEFIIDERELKRESPSYMIETLVSLRADFEEQPLYLIVGADAFNQLPDWHQWEKLLDFCHIIIINRADNSLSRDPRLIQLLQTQQVTDPKQLERSLAGHILIVNIEPIAISSTELREDIKKDMSSLLPKGVWEYIQRHTLYT